MSRTITSTIFTAFALIACYSSAFAAGASSPETVTYEQHVRPILKANCFHCHGEGAELQGNLDLRLRRLVFKGGDSGAAVVPGNPEQSPLFTRVRDGEMPPEEIEKKLTPAEADVLRRWVATGAKVLREEPEDANPNSYLTQEERNFWAFRPIRNAALPQVSDGCRISTPVDRFVLASLEQHKLTFAPVADRRTLLRRVFLDLLGLPPTPAEVDEFLQDNSPDAFEKLVDRLLSSPQYGERWGRHWLDTAGYSDSEGYNDDDVIRPDAWKYRDYVIQAFNSNKPFDRFVREQLAGDELVGRELKDLTPEQVEWLTATAFLRMAPDGTGSGGVDQNVARNEVMAKTIEIVSSSILGLTVGCAQCHNHRYDPITQEDYYALRAVFEPALNWKSWLVPAARRVSLYTDADRKRAAEVEVRAKQIEEERAKKQQEFILRTLEKELAKLAPELHAPLRAARDTAAANRTPEQKKLLQQYPSVKVDAGSLYLYDQKAADELKKMSEEAVKIRGEKPREEFVRALWEPMNQSPPKTFLFYRGLVEQPKQELPPRPPRILATTHPAEFPTDDPAIPTSGRRLAFAKWLTSGPHPLTARVIVNRLWLHHFGQGLVATPSDFGFLGARPSHPELLDWLASEFISSGWDVKRLQRLIVTSAVYRQNSIRRADAEGIDQENRWYWRMPVRRVDAETLRDSVLAISDRLNLKAFGTSVPVMADNVGQFVVGIENLNAGRPGEVIPLGGEEFRRSIYIQVRRSRPLSVLDPFDLPRMEPNCAARASSTVATQSLLLMNNEFVTDSAAAFAQRVLQIAGKDVVGQVRLAWKIVYVAEPSPEELSGAAQYVLDQSLHYATHPPTPDPSQKKPPPKPDPQLEALTTFCHALLSSNRFLYVD
jgi:mono/diheme cytochrome c family protein